MLRLLGVMLSVLCLVSPAPHSNGRACPDNSVFMETIEVLRQLRSKASSEIMPLYNMTETGANAATYLEGFIEALNNSKESVEQKHIIVKLKMIKAYAESCTGWTSALKEHHWKAVEEYDFFDNLDYFLRFLAHNALPEETN